MTDTDPYLGQVLDEKYRLERLLGRGGMGAVYLATHLGTERYVALKLITPQYMRNEEFVARFKREARAAGRLRHPNVVDVTDFGFAHAGTEAVAYLVMEYLDGCTLADVLVEGGRLDLQPPNHRADSLHHLRGTQNPPTGEAGVHVQTSGGVELSDLVVTGNTSTGSPVA